MAKKMDIDSFQYFWAKLKTWVLGNLNNKVDKVPGKGLSANNYDNIAKNKVNAIPSNPKYTDTTYTAGDKVTYNSQHYVSLIDYNVWSPDVAPQYWNEVI